MKKICALIALGMTTVFAANLYSQMAEPVIQDTLISTGRTKVPVSSGAAAAQAAVDKAAADSDPKVKLTEKTYLKDYAASDSDRLINAKIRDKITDGTFNPKFGNIVIYTIDGDVTLSGVLTTTESIKNIEASVIATPGVKKVKNNMFAPATQPVPQDAK
jgi:osmotically-inducible protein OsmY